MKKKEKGQLSRKKRRRKEKSFSEIQIKKERGKRASIVKFQKKDQNRGKKGGESGTSIYRIQLCKEGKKEEGGEVFYIS